MDTHQLLTNLTDAARLADGQPARFPERLGHLKTLTRPYDGDWYFVPAVGGSVRGLHPLMAWWAVVHGLSNLCRYQPSDWAQHINVDGSPHAVPIEKLLTEAIRVLPRLVEETIATVAV
ncbi:hypothetical protein GCM10018781_60850 [Kitasatospora indigofera]|uniref:Uncharacterized protein n=1 Tax=Kitasatospora indigofera TaxID=67307 RepID=A0A919GAN6_9ACTN|nr:hypothetical protein [Kitasatospora indigofera]GHH80459.1 hypothetical protein GCM10018781_60850 [Kitasatospora indigofera]